MKKSAIGLSLLAAAFTSTSSFGVTLFEENFDTETGANWTVNDLGQTDFTAVFGYDYSAIGVPEAPNSTGSTATTGFKMYANEFFGAFGGGSVSPTGLDLGTGDYTLYYDFWNNYHGPILPVGGSGTTQLSYAGIMTSGTFSNEIGSADGIFFGNTLDGDSSADWRAYSSGVQYSHQVVGDPDGTGVLNGVNVYPSPDTGADPNGKNQRDSGNSYWTDQFPGVEPPAAQLALFPGEQIGLGPANSGTTAFQWAEGRITKSGDIVTWHVNGILAATIDLSDDLFDPLAVEPNPIGNPGAPGNPTGGNNIFFGQSDTNGGTSANALFTTLTVSIFDNICVDTGAGGCRVTALAGDLNVDGFVGVDDLNIVLLNWNQNVTPGDLGTGDPSGDGFVGVDDLNVVLVNWNNGTPPAGGAAIPEPASLALLGMGGVAMLRRRR